MSKICSGTFQSQYCTALTDEICSMRSDDVNSEDFSILRIGNDLEEAGDRLSNNSCLAQGREWEFGYLQFVTRFPGSVLCQANAGDFRVAVCRIGNPIIANRVSVDSGDALDRDDSLSAGDMRQLSGTGDDVADGEDMTAGGALVRLNRNVPVIDLDADLVQFQRIGNRLPADGAPR